MGVMSCSRKGCDNILCDTYVSGVGYVCYECQKDFLEYAKRHLNSRHTINDDTLKMLLIVFLDEQCGDRRDYDIDDKINEFFKQYTQR